MKISIIGDSIILRQTQQNLKAYPYYVFNEENIDIFSYTSNVSTNLSTLIQNYAKTADLLIIHLGICDCFPRFKLKDITSYEQRVSAKDFEKNIKNAIKQISSKVILTSIVKPSKKFTKINNYNYYHIANQEINKYNNIMKEISKNNKNVYYANLEEEIPDVLKKYFLTYEEMFFDASGHTTPILDHEPKVNNKQKIIEIYSEIYKNSLIKNNFFN